MAGKCVAAKVPALRGRNRRRIRLTRFPSLHFSRASSHEGSGPPAVGAEQIRSLSAARSLRGGEGGGSGASSPQASWLLHLTEVKINCNRKQNSPAVSSQLWVL